MTGLSEGADTLNITIEMRISDKESVVKSTDIEVEIILIRLGSTVQTLNFPNAKTRKGN